jgi:parallel beta-helix repeat protein
MIITTTYEDSLCYTYNNTISNNTFLKNKKGIYLFSTEGNNITHNLFQKNSISAFFINCQKNIWYNNYWNRGRILPKIIFGYKTIFNKIPIPWFNIDKNPAKKIFNL